MNYLTLNNLDSLCLGAALLGSGGGGDTDTLRDYLHYTMSQYGSVEILSINEIEKDTLIVPVAMLGAPVVGMERIPAKKLFTSMINCIKEAYPDKIIVLMPAEIGGSNALTPFVLASMSSFPVLDADLIGRAFPKISMCKPAANGVNNFNAYITNLFGDVEHIEASSIAALEEQARNVAVKFGSDALISAFLFSGDQIANYVIEGSISRAFAVSSALKRGGFENSFASGVVTEVIHQIENGFLVGSVLIKDGQDEYKVYFQNEYFVVLKNKKILYETPAIISLVEEQTNRPVSSESLRFGLKVNILCLEAPIFWQHPQAQSCVNLGAFGFVRGEYV